MQLRLRSNKTQLYNLVKENSLYQLPPLSQTEFKKAYRSRLYWLYFNTDTGQVRATFGGAGGIPFLWIHHTNYNTDKVDNDNVLSLNINALAKRKMVEEKEIKPRRVNKCL